MYATGLQVNIILSQNEETIQAGERFMYYQKKRGEYIFGNYDGQISIIRCRNVPQ